MSTIRFVDAGRDDPDPALAAGSGAFRDYELDSTFHDELFHEDGTPRARVRRLGAALSRIPLQDLERIQDGVYRRFVHEGITFTVLGVEDVSEQIIPIDCVPRLITAEEWDHLERGLKQRLTALNLFLHDVYHEGKSLRDGVVPTDLVLGCPQYRLEMRELRVPHDVYVAVCGTDIVRVGDSFAVLEDNLRVPSGVSYMLACRTAMKWAFPYLYRAYGVREVAEYPERLYSTLASLALTSGTPRMAVLTPGRYNSAYYEHAFLAGEMGVDLVEGRDLVVHDATLYARTAAGLRRIDVLYRRIDDDFLDPVTFREDSVLGAPGLFHAYRAGNLVLANAPGTGVADDKGLYAYVPRIIRYFLDEEPILANVETHLCREPDGLAYTLEHLHELVVKEVGGSGGYGMLVGPHASAAEREEYAARLREDPTNFISQPVLPLSRAGCFVDGRLQPRHVDLRPFVLQGRDRQHVVPGGLCRVALRKGSLVVNSSQGGGCKDLWILRC
ncbi:circularly permuted type 2 ATP-grasp protein [Candidatus Palauibacter sp.]|uniref:circularly permuted type 2 ATP-grasp protein n=1 Tax=Candidatus Palauibacter sp. TaxID=3101350 RepID=UPI003AF27144